MNEWDKKYVTSFIRRLGLKERERKKKNNKQKNKQTDTHPHTKLIQSQFTKYTNYAIKNNMPRSDNYYCFVFKLIYATIPAIFVKNK